MLIETDIKIDDIALIQRLNHLNSEFLPDIKKVYDLVKDLLDQRIPVVFPNYTQHDINHSLRIMKYMAQLVPDLELLDELEIVLLVYSALLHDVGMAVSQSDIDLIKSDNFKYFDIKYSTLLKNSNNDEQLALQEYVRMFHSSFSAKYIKENLRSHLQIPKQSLDFADELALICESHTKSYDWLVNNLQPYDVKGDFHFNSQFIACILRLADILDFDSNRTPYNLFKIISPQGISKEEWEQHFVIANNDKILIDEKTNQKKIVFQGKCDNARIHRKVLSYIDWVKNELEHSSELTNKMPEKYNLFFDTSPKVNIQTQSYSFSDYKMTLNYRAVSALLMGEKIYGSRSLGLRELVQNSIDSCKIRQELENQNLKFGEDKYIPKVKVVLDATNDTVTIKDNGMGMSIEIIKRHFLNIGVSYYNSRDFKLKDYNYRPIGNFGIGFLSCFMLSETAKVATRFYNDKDKFIIDLERNEDYCSLTKVEDVEFYGTEIILNYTEFLNAFDDNEDGIHPFLQKFFLTDDVVIEVINVKKRSILNIENPFIYENSNALTIDLGNYIKDFYGYVDVKKKRNFVRNIFDLDIRGQLYSYSGGNDLQKIDDKDSINFNDYLINGELDLFFIPIVNEQMAYEYKKGLEFMENDYEELLEKLSYGIEWITVIFDKALNVEKYSITYNEFGKNNKTIVENFTFDSLLKLRHVESCDVKILFESYKFFEAKSNELYVTYVSHTNSEFPFVSFRGFDQHDKVYVRNVLVQDFYVDIPTCSSIIEVGDVFLNIQSKKILPDISRNNFDKLTSEYLNFVIGKAIHIGAIEKFNLTGDSKDAMEKFINRFYSDPPQLR